MKIIENISKITKLFIRSIEQNIINQLCKTFLIKFEKKKFQCKKRQNQFQFREKKLGFLIVLQYKLLISLIDF